MIQENCRIAVVLRGRIGDLMCTWPLLNYLKRQMPSCRIHLFGEPVHRELAPLIPAIDRLWVLPMSHTQYAAGWRYGALWRGQFDMAIAAHTRPRSWVSWFLRSMGAPRQYAFVDGRRRFSQVTHPRLWNAPYEEAHHESFKLLQLVDPSIQELPAELHARLQLPEASDATRVTVSVSSHRAACQLSLEAMARALNRLSGVSFAISHVPADRARAHALAAQLRAPAQPVETPSLHQLLQLLQSSRCVVTSEGGISHLTAALDRPQLVLFGGTSPIQWAPLSSRAVVLAHPEDVNRIDPAHIDTALERLLHA